MKEKYKNFEKTSDRQQINKDLTFVVAFALEDEVRKDVPSSIQKLKNMNIEVRMISGDYLVTAKATAI